MKKLTVAAAFFAVSSVLSSAASFVTPTISWSDFSNVTPTANTAVNNDDNSGSIYFAGSDYLPTKSGNTLVFDGSKSVIFVKKANNTNLGYANNTGTFTFTATSITLPTSDSSSSHSVLATYQDSGGNQLGIGVDSDGYLVGVNTTSGDIFQNSKSSKTITATDTNTFTFVLDGSTGLRAYVNGELYLTVSALKYTNSNTAKQMTVGGTSTPKLCTGMTVSNIYIHDTSLSTEQVAATFTAGGLIPEPSAFGLLAGIGALALAVSRRRRSRR